MSPSRPPTPQDDHSTSPNTPRQKDSHVPTEQLAPEHTGAGATRGRTAGRFLPTLIVLGGLALGMLLGLAHYVVQPPRYTATTLVSVVPAPDRMKGPQALDSLGQIRWSQALARIAVLPQIAGPALTAAGQPDKAAAPNETITVSAAPDTAVFTITAQDSDARKAAAAADAVAAGAAKACADQQLPVRVSTAPAPQPAAPVPGLMVRVVLGACVGLAAALIVLLVGADRRRNA